MRRPITFLFASLFVLALLTAASLAAVAPAAAATIAPTTSCNNALGNGGAVCEITIANTITPTRGSAVVTVRECTGSAGVPDATCSNTTTALTEPVTAVTQCDGSINGGGGTLRCSIVITNTYVGFTANPAVSAVTVNQCVGSVTTGTVQTCNPFPATTTGATITQCNGSGNGGGASLTCTATGTQAAGFTMNISQCNGSTNGGGTLTVCSANISNVVFAPGAPGLPNAAMAGRSSGSLASGAFVTGSLLLLLFLALTSIRRSPAR